MKRLLIFFAASLAFASCHNANTQIKGGVSADVNTVAKADAPVIKFAEEVHQFDKINEGEKVEYNFKFTNVGKSPLIIASATATCGCTIPEPPKEPILPGKDGFIKVVFNSAGKPGINDKVITVNSNASPNISSVHLVGEVTPNK